MSKQKKEKIAPPNNLFSKELTEQFLHESTLKVKEKEESSMDRHEIYSQMAENI